MKARSGLALTPSQFTPLHKIWFGILKRLCVKASGLGLCQASQHDADHGEINPGFFTAGEHLIVFVEPAPSRKPGEGALDNQAVGKNMKATGSDLVPIYDGILGSQDAS